MSDVQLFELANVAMRIKINLVIKESVFIDVFARHRPEAYDLKVFKDFYCFRLPESSEEEINRQARIFGKILVKEIPGFIPAMRRYYSSGHPISNQLFRKVLGKRRQAYCKSELQKIGYYRYSI